MNGKWKRSIVLGTAGILSVLTAGCERGASPAETQAAVANAQVAGAKSVAEASRNATLSTMDAQKDANKANDQLAHETAEATRNVRIAQAEAGYKVAIEKCGALTGDDRVACTKQADADVASAKSDAKAAERAADPRP
ncbi:MAG TPA: hypothetical protein VFA75_22825 [Nevskia sp.]|jgi:hypothetical protein|nr:hypothetical protein [Nevskia sp.]